jgi:putative membrane protein
MNRKVTKIAHLTALACFLLIGGIVTAKNIQRYQPSAVNVAAVPFNQNANSSTTEIAPAKLGLADRKFVLEAAMGGMAEVELGRLATQKGMSAAIKTFGQRMVDDHSAANSELTTLASGKGLTLPTTLDAKHRAVMNRLSRLSGAAFDRAYARDMLNDHIKDVAAFKRESRMARDADLKAFAGSKLPTLEEHLTMARELNKMKPAKTMNHQ